MPVTDVRLSGYRHHGYRALRSPAETPLHKLEPVCRRLTERLTTASSPPSAFRQVVDAWFYALAKDALAGGATEDKLAEAVDRLMTARLAEVTDINPGNKISVAIAFDVSPGTVPATIEFHDSMFSGGVRVAVK